MMLASVCPVYGPPEVMEVRSVETLVAGPGDVIVRVHAASVSAADYALMTAEIFAVRLMFGLRRPRASIMGNEAAGVVASIGSAVTGFAVGDHVVVLSPKSQGAHAEFLRVAATGLIARTTDALPFTHRAALLEAGTAVKFFRDIRPVLPGERVLINGASGAVGTTAVQVAALYGAHVTAVCSAGNAELVRSLGAVDVIDYATTDFTRGSDRFDVVLDAVGTRTYRDVSRVLTASGMMLATKPSAGVLAAMLLGRRAKFAATGLMQTRADLEALVDLSESGALRATIDASFTLSKIEDALRLVGTGHKRGCVVVTM
jgi:NADPH:quinone reductase-like Zn-dependent oxidoreductase